MCGNSFVLLRDLHGYLFDAAPHRMEDQFDILRRSSAGQMLRLVLDPAKESLWSLIQKTAHLRCVDPRDRAYAMLSIAEDGKHGITPRYTIAVRVLLNRILNSMHGISSPESLHEVAKQCEELESLFGEPLNSMFVTEGPVQFSPDKNPLEQLEQITAQGNVPDPRFREWLSGWCKFYSHRLVQGLVLACDLNPHSEPAYRLPNENGEKPKGHGKKRTGGSRRKLNTPPDEIIALE
jgi:hypothetical protein